MKSWTYFCKNFIIGLFTLIIISVLVLVGYEVFSGHINTTVCVSLIGVIGIIIPVLGATLATLLHHERNKKPKGEKDV